MNPPLTNFDLLTALDDKVVRDAWSDSLAGFCFIYLTHYLGLPPAAFHPELLQILEKPPKQYLSILGFRGSAKSTFSTVALPLWAALKMKANFIILFTDTDAQAELMINNIRHELEENDLIQQDYGDLSIGVDKSRTWTKHNLLLSNGVRIMSRSRGQRVRGLRHLQFRPDLVILDDVEEAGKVQKKEYRDKTDQWLRGEIIPAIEENKARLIVVGNALHTDSLMARLKRDNLFEHREYALLDDKGNITWPGKYPDMESVKRQEAKVRHNLFMREYLLKVIPPEGQEIRPEWIKYYKIPPEVIAQTGVGVDLAISKRETADYTAAVTGQLYHDSDRPKIAVMPNLVNRRLTFLETVDQLKMLNEVLKPTGTPIFFIEEVSYQKAAIEEAQRNMLYVVPMKPTGDKRARLRTVATFIQNGMIEFPDKGCEDLIDQLLGFGIEDHDDLVDAFVYMIMGLVNLGTQKLEITSLF